MHASGNHQIRSGQLYASVSQLSNALRFGFSSERMGIKTLSLHLDGLRLQIQHPAHTAHDGEV